MRLEQNMQINLVKLNSIIPSSRMYLNVIQENRDFLYLRSLRDLYSLIRAHRNETNTKENSLIEVFPQFERLADNFELV